MDHLGMDVHKMESQICILTEAGELIERRVHTEPQRFAAVLGDRPRARILLEASTDSEWVARCLEALGQKPDTRILAQVLDFLSRDRSNNEGSKRNL